jgi:hypothetical protein
LCEPAGVIEDERLDDDRLDVVRARWVLEGVHSLREAATNLRAFAADLEQLEREGWQLVGQMEGDRGVIRWVAQPRPIG